MTRQARRMISELSGRPNPDDEPDDDENDMDDADETPEGDGTEPETGETEEHEAAETPEKEQEEEEQPEEAVNNDAVVKDLIDELRKFDIIMPDGTNDQNFLERLQVGLKTAAAHQGLDDKDDNASETDTTIADAGGVAMMSLEVRKVIETADRQHRYAENQHRDAVAASLQSLLDSGRCTPAEFHEHADRLHTVRLSLDDSGNPEPSDLDKWIRSRQPLPKGTFWEPAEVSARMALSVEELPDSMVGKESEAKVNAVLNAVFHRK